MTDITVEPPKPVSRFQHLRLPFLLALNLLALALVLNLLSDLGGLALDDEVLLESTLGRLATWMAQQTGNDPAEILSPWAMYAENWANELGMERLDPDILYTAMRNLRIAYYGLIVLLLVYTVMAIVVRPRRAPALLFVILLLLNALLFLIPSLEGSNALTLLVFAIMAVLAATVLSPGKINRVVGFCLALSFLLVGWEASKAIADSLSYKILLPQQSWTYHTEETMEDALAALLAGDVDYVIADRKDLDDMMPPHPPKGDGSEALPYQELRYLASLDRREGVAILPITPAFPGRLSIAVRADDAPKVAGVRDAFGGEIATIAGDFAEERFLSQPRSLVLLDLKILNDLNLPHLQMIAEAFLQPARRNGELLLLRILTDAGIYTFSEAIFGFVFGAVLGFILGSFFRPLAVDGAGIAALCRGIADGADPGDSADGCHLARRRSALGGGHRRLPDLLPGDHQYPARFAIAGGRASGTAAFLCREPLDDHVEAAPSGGAALYFHGAESLGDGERRWRDHWRVALRHRRRAGAGDPRLQLGLQYGVDAEALGFHRHGGDRRHSLFRRGQSG